MVKITRKDKLYICSAGRRRMELDEETYLKLKRAMGEFARNDYDGDLVAIEIDDKGLITVTKPLITEAES